MSAAPPQPAPPVLRIEGLEKRFGGVAALQGIDYAVPGGIIQAVIGPNGAGKTTLFNCISGVIKPSNGGISFNGGRIEGLPPHKIAGLGISRTFQHVALFKKMTVLENVMLGRHSRTRSGFLATGFRFPGMRSEEKGIRQKAFEYLDFVRLAQVAGLEAGTLPLGKQKTLEIARALAVEPRLILIDEPAGGLNMRETEELGDLIQQIKQLGVTVLLVEHDMNLIMEISDRILVLNYGEALASGTPAEIKENSAVIEAYLGMENSQPVASQKRGGRQPPH
ncbi:MAG: ABC transporter ATP-binding protein [Syntrophobacteraceae bacterium]|jgi:branched-chain amino acid transport system ATP-binding protein